MKKTCHALVRRSNTTGLGSVSSGSRQHLAAVTPIGGSSDQKTWRRHGSAQHDTAKSRRGLVTAGLRSGSGDFSPESQVAAALAGAWRPLAERHHRRSITTRSPPGGSARPEVAGSGRTTAEAMEGTHACRRARPPHSDRRTRARASAYVWRHPGLTRACRTPMDTAPAGGEPWQRAALSLRRRCIHSNLTPSGLWIYTRGRIGEGWVLSCSPWGK